MGKVDDLSNEIEQMRQRLNEMDSATQSNHKRTQKQPATTSDLASVTTASPSVNRDIDMLQKKIFALEDRSKTQGEQIENIMSNVLSLSRNMEKVLNSVNELNTSKADNAKVETLVGEKASLRNLDYKVDRPYFDNAIRDLVQQLESLSSRIDEVIHGLDDRSRRPPPTESTQNLL